MIVDNNKTVLHKNEIGNYHFSENSRVLYDNKLSEFAISNDTLTFFDHIEEIDEVSIDGDNKKQKVSTKKIKINLKTQMNKTLKIIFITLFAVFVIIIAVIKTSSNNKYSINITKNNGKIKIPVSEYNFGEISYRDSVGYDFKIMNIGETPVVLSKISPSCNCTSLEYKNNDIQPADFLTIKAKFKPKKEDIGRNKITIFLKGNFEQENYILSLEGNVTE